MDSEHLSYPNPTIIKAICDIHFRLPEAKGWKPSFTASTIDLLSALEVKDQTNIEH